jgi:hypothetical protein
MTVATPIRIDEYGDEQHESWLLIRANVTSASHGAHLFGSDIQHQHYVVVTVTRCTRKRDLNRDWLHGTQVLLEIAMSQAQWGAFVSSFGDGSGVPATLRHLVGEGRVSQAPPESRFDESHREVGEAGDRALAEVQASYDKLAAAFETGGKRAQREALRDLGIRLSNAPKNMEFAAESLTKHVEKVVTTARADIEAMALTVAENQHLSASATLELEEKTD